MSEELLDLAIATTGGQVDWGRPPARAGSAGIQVSSSCVSA
jgi:hypothetical protein